MKRVDGRSISRETLEYLIKQSIRLWKNDKDIEDIADFCWRFSSQLLMWVYKVMNDML